MNRHVLASEALSLSRSLLQQVPVSVRIASLAHGFLRVASNQDALWLEIGLQALVAMEKVNTPGDVEGSTIEELRPWIKRNALSKLKGIASKLGGKIYRMSMAGRGTISHAVVEQAWDDATRLLERHPPAADRNVGQVLHYMANALTMRLKDVIKIRKRHNEVDADPDFADTIHHEHSTPAADVATWKRIEHQFKNDPLLLGPKGEPWAWIFLEGKAGGMSEAEIIAQWNEVSRRSGGEGEMTRTQYLNWLRAAQRRALMVELAKRYLDEGLVRRLKLAVAGGALDRTLLHPFERDLLELLAA